MDKSLGDLGLTARGGNAGARVRAITLDSRAVRPGTLFAALPGTRMHGAEFIDPALRMGASAILTDRDGARIAASALARHPDTALVVAEDARAALAMAAALFFGDQPATLVAVTGTNGKTSVASFARQIWTAMGLSAINIGTTGVEGAWEMPLAHTTPDSVTLQRLLAQAAAEGVTHAAMEASSHGLDQRRLEGVRLAAAGFTNLTQDHLDYHPSMEAYFQAKAGLFTRLLPPDGVAVINTDDAYGARLAGQVPQSVVRVGSGPDCDLRLLAQRFSAHGQVLRFALNGRVQQVDLGLVGGFQAANALVALGLVIATGADPIEAGQAMAHLKGVRGRMQLAATRANGAPVFVDYAHTPAAVETALKALRPHVMGRLIIVLGAGGDRDRGKRPLMGAAAAENADVVFVTDDNPRSENPAVIRAEILKACPEATEVGDRAEAILRAVDALQPGDALLIAGKGHETGQTVAGVVYPFDDLEQASVAVAALDGGAVTMVLWTGTEAETATGGAATAPFSVTGISIDTRSLQPGDLFVALKAARDGHDFVAQAFENGAAAALVSHVPPGVSGPCLVVDDVLRGLTALGEAGRARTRARVIGVTGSVGKTSTKEMLRAMLDAFGSVHAAEASFNNHWGVPITLARLPRDTDFAVVEIGMNHPGEIAPLARLARPDVAMITTVAPAHLEAFESLEGIAREKSDIYLGLQDHGTAVFPNDLDVTPILESAAPRARISFGEGGEVCLTSMRQANGATVVSARVEGQTYHIRLADAGAHFARNALGCLAVAKALDLDLALAAQALGRWRPPAGRGKRESLLLDPATDARAVLIDDAFNANPASLAAALDVLAATDPGPGGRRIAILGDMLELGPDEVALHQAVARHPALTVTAVVHCVGPRMAHLWQALPESKRGRCVPRAEDLVDRAHHLLHPGDVVLVKGSKGSYVSRVVDALRHLSHSMPEDPTGE